jgi:hypothetical protein
VRDEWRRRLEDLCVADVACALRPVQPAWLAALAGLVGARHARSGGRGRARLARRIVAAAPMLGDADALLLAIVLTAALHDELLAAARAGELRSEHVDHGSALAHRWSPALLALELALVRAETGRTG